MFPIPQVKSKSKIWINTLCCGYGTPPRKPEPDEAAEDELDDAPPAFMKTIGC